MSGEKCDCKTCSCATEKHKLGVPFTFETKYARGTDYSLGLDLDDGLVVEDSVTHNCNEPGCAIIVEYTLQSTTRGVKEIRIIRRENGARPGQGTVTVKYVQIV